MSHTDDADYTDNASFHSRGRQAECRHPGGSTSAARAKTCLNSCAIALIIIHTLIYYYQQNLN